MRRYLLDTNILNAYMQGRSRVLSLVQKWVYDNEAATSLIVYGEIVEYLKSFPNYARRAKELRDLLRKVYPYDLNYSLLEGYADLAPGDGMILPAHILHSASVGEQGVTCLEATR